MCENASLPCIPLQAFPLFEEILAILSAIPLVPPGLIMTKLSQAGEKQFARLAVIVDCAAARNATFNRVAAQNASKNDLGRPDPVRIEPDWTSRFMQA
jgi:hypothetical protein